MPPRLAVQHHARSIGRRQAGIFHPSSVFVQTRVPVACLSNTPARCDTAKTSLRGIELLNNPLYNKGMAFTRPERRDFGIDAYLPYEVHTLQQQQKRAWQQFLSRRDDLARNTFLTSLRDQNRVLYYSLLLQHIEEVMPIIYTPTQGQAIEDYSRLFRRPEGLFLSYPERETMEKDFLSYVHENQRQDDEIDLIVVSDGEGVLGIGDQGIGGGVGITTAKSAVYTVCAGIDPSRAISVGLDVGTNNRKLLDDDLYVGWNHERITGEEYDKFVDKFCNLVKKHFPNALLHFEDFGVNNALRLLDKYRPIQSVFNDDIQGTAAMALTCILAASKVTGTKLTDHRYVIHGAGTAGLGIARQIRSALREFEENMTEEEASKHFYLIDRDGLIREGLSSVRDSQKGYARSKSELETWDLSPESKDSGKISLKDVVRNVHPTVLIGCSTQAGAFDEEIVKSMTEHTEHPIILPLSNPIRLSECKPADAYTWSRGKALLASGSPFPPISIEGGEEKYTVAQCNNALIYPGLALGTIVSKSSKLSDGMIVSGINALAELSPCSMQNELKAPLLPSFVDSRSSSAKVATAVVLKAKEEGLARAEEVEKMSDQQVEEYVKERMWKAEYRQLQYVPRH